MSASCWAMRKPLRNNLARRVCGRLTVVIGPRHVDNIQNPLRDATATYETLHSVGSSAVDTIKHSDVSISVVM